MAACLQGPYGRGLVIAVLAGVLMASAGAFGSGAAPLLPRLVYWIAVMAGGTVLGVAVSRLVMDREWLASSVWAQAGLISLLMAVPYSVVVWLVARFAFPHAPMHDPAAHFGAVLIVSAAMTAVNMLASRRPLETHAAVAPARFLERLPPKLRGAELYAVEAEDHYLRLHTSRGSDLILMRLSDAVAELEGLEGAQTHRSWWVAKDAVTNARRADGRAVLVLKSGVEAPVSRSYVKTLRAEGWF